MRMYGYAVVVRMYGWLVKVILTITLILTLTIDT